VIVERRAARLLLSVGAVIGVAAALSGGRLLYARMTAGDPAPERIRAFVSASLDTIDTQLAALDRAASHDARVAAFREARRAFKRAEGALAYFVPSLVVALNSNEIQAVDEDQASGRRTPRGFALIETDIFAPSERDANRDARRELAAMRTAVARARPIVGYIAPTPVQLLELARLELARVSTLGVAGFDAPFSGDAIAESAAAVEGITNLLRASGGMDGGIVRTMMNAAAYLQAHENFVDFDRFEFVRSYANPAFRALAEQRRTLEHSSAPVRRTWPIDVASVYDARHFDALSYAPPDATPPTPALVSLGRSLFFDSALSGGGDRSCATCHVPERGFTDGLPRALTLDRAENTNRHTPSLIGAGLQPAQFADARRGTLEEQIADVLASRTEMASPLDAVVRRLTANDRYRARFAALEHAPEPAPAANPVTAGAVQRALASYVRSLSGFNSRFDRALRGDDTVTIAERRGFNLFMGKAGCGSCHFAPLFNGTAPPDFVLSDPEIIGVPKSVTDLSEVDPDLGRGAIDRRKGLAHSFKTPTVRNAALGGPYMHNGAFRTLDELLDFYDRGGGRGGGASVPNQTLSSDSLHLTTADRRDLLAFLGSLVDTVGMTERPRITPAP
jgi:cytochrome c peroxidase